MGLSSQDTMLIMIVVPVIEGIAFWCVLRTPAKPDILETMSSTATIVTDKTGVQSTDLSEVENTHELSEEERPLVGLKNKLKYIPSLFKYAVPLTLVYFLEYLINQGLVSIEFSTYKNKEDFSNNSLLSLNSSTSRAFSSPRPSNTDGCKSTTRSVSSFHDPPSTSSPSTKSG